MDIVKTHRTKVLVRTLYGYHRFQDTDEARNCARVDKGVLDSHRKIDILFADKMESGHSQLIGRLLLQSSKSNPRWNLHAAFWRPNVSQTLAETHACTQPHWQYIECSLLWWRTFPIERFWLPIIMDWPCSSFITTEHPYLPWSTKHLICRRRVNAVCYRSSIDRLNRFYLITPTSRFSHTWQQPDAYYHICYELWHVCVLCIWYAIGRLNVAMRRCTMACNTRGALLIFGNPGAFLFLFTKGMYCYVICIVMWYVLLCDMYCEYRPNYCHFDNRHLR